MLLYPCSSPDDAPVNRCKNLVMTAEATKTLTSIQINVMSASSNYVDWLCSAARSDRFGGHNAAI